ncbi:MAG: hemerythrin domain-containing protein [Bacteroidetes bacterium]|nr:hemerythrin domain-containing protein [Bacteroidota bacterium]
MFTKNSILKNIVSEEPKALSVLERLHLSTMLDKKIDDVGKESGFDADFLLTAIKVFTADEISVYKEFSNYPLHFILRYLQRTHSYYITKKLPEIEQSLNHLFIHFKDTHPLLIILSNFFLIYQDDLICHIENEEMKLFPYIHKLLSVQEKKCSYREMLHITNGYSLNIFTKEHTDVESDLKEIRNLILQHSPTYPTPFPYRVFLTQLQAFEEDLHMHHIIEEEILVPRAKIIEKELIEKRNLRQELLQQTICYS